MGDSSTASRAGRWRPNARGEGQLIGARVAGLELDEVQLRRVAAHSPARPPGRAGPGPQARALDPRLEAAIHDLGDRVRSHCRFIKRY